MAFEEPAAATTSNPKSCIPLDGAKMNILSAATPNAGDSAYTSGTNFFSTSLVHQTIILNYEDPVMFDFTDLWESESETSVDEEIPVPERGLARQNTELTYCEWEYEDYDQG